MEQVHPCRFQDKLFSMLKSSSRIKRLKSVIKVEFLKTNSKKVLKIDRDKNIRYIHLYISDISNISDIRHDSVMINISPG